MGTVRGDGRPEPFCTVSGCAPWWTNLEAILVEKERKREKDSASPTKPSRHFPLSDSQEEKPDPSVQKKNSE
jgi:hypothetical protein